MNERIAKFAEQAGNIVVEDKWNGDYVEFNKEKFAELIIRDCAEMMPQDNLYKMILKRFGVEK